MDVAFKEKGKDLSIYGHDFSLQKWCESWLNSSGINIIEPTDVQANGDKMKIVLTQSNDLRGKNRLRLHKIDIALYNENKIGVHSADPESEK